MKNKAIILLCAIAMLAVGATFQPALSAPISLLGQWDVIGSDNFSYEALLEFTVQTSQGDNFHLEGFFIWDQIEGPRGGTELFEGTFFPNLALELKGVQLINPVGIGLATYQGIVSSDGDSISGTWSPPAGVWTATRREVSNSVPEPATFLLLSLGVPSLFWMKKRYKKR